MELSLGECEFEPADDACLSHAGNAVVFCGAHGAAPFSDGQLRLVSDSGAPVLPHDAGRLEMYLVQAQAWAPVCRKGFTSGSAAVACKSMSFAGSSGFSSCAASGLCGAVAPHVADLACAGSESSVLQCPMAVTDDVFCAPEESVVLSCSGCHKVQSCVVAFEMENVKTQLNGYAIVGLSTAFVLELVSLHFSYESARPVLGLVNGLDNTFMPPVLLCVTLFVLILENLIFFFSSTPWFANASAAGLPVYTSIYVEWLINVPILLVLAGCCALNRSSDEVARPLLVTMLGPFRTTFWDGSKSGR
eukprot:s84_g16.t1